MEDRFEFRAWDWFLKKYIMDHTRVYRLLTMEDNCYIYEQCTGLKDKNGKLIYEGDIVEVPEFYNDIPTGKTRRHKVSYKHAAFNIYSVNTEHLEIIGNIHENPELLEEK